MPQLKDLVGQRFGRLVILYRAPNRKKEVCWVCVCDCGIIKSVMRSSLGRIYSCGCQAKEVAAKNAKKLFTTHGLSKTPEYRTWAGMKNRCYNSNDRTYQRYGAKGIRVCDRWRNSFEAFLADMGEKPTPRHTIDRKDNAKGYSPDNCRWATYGEQSRNRDIVILYDLDGIPKSIPQLAKIYDMKAPTVRYRMNRGWSIEKALTAPLRKGSHNNLDTPLTD